VWATKNVFFFLQDTQLGRISWRQRQG